jgi:hypothetical protein
LSFQDNCATSALALESWISRYVADNFIIQLGKLRNKRQSIPFIFIEEIELKVLRSYHSVSLIGTCLEQMRQTEKKRFSY